MLAGGHGLNVAVAKIMIMDTDLAEIIDELFFCNVDLDRDGLYLILVHGETPVYLRY